MVFLHVTMKLKCQILVGFDVKKSFLSMYSTYKIHSCFAIATKLAPAYGNSIAVFPPLSFSFLCREEH
jgi:hypothetical protein